MKQATQASTGAPWGAIAALAAALAVPGARAAEPVPVAASAAAAAPAAASAPAPAAAPAALFGRVGSTVITQDEYAAAFNAAVRSKFYHGRPPEAEIAKLQHEVADQLVARVALLDEARRRALQPVEAELQKRVAQFDQRYANNEHWKANRESLVASLLLRLREESQLAQLEQAVRAGAVPDDAQVKAFYDANLAKFTEPVRNRVAMILLHVEASAPDAQWEKAGLKAEGLVKKIRDGADFGAIARKHSNDKSAAKGGELGYQHGGMLSDVADATLAKLEVGQTSDPQRVLEGIAVFRLLERIPPKLQPFGAVAERARELARRALSDQTWNAFVAAQVAKVDAKVDRTQLLPLAPAGVTHAP